MKIRAHWLAGHVALCGGLLLATACSRPTPGSESALAPAGLHTGQRRPIPAETLVYPLVEGSFTIVNRDGAGITGTYSGTSRFPGDGRQQASLTLRVTGGWGKFAGATGSVAVTGTGAFADEGRFVLDGDGEVTLAGGKRATVVLKLSGSSTASCSASERIAIAQTADGAMGRAGRVTATLSHEVVDSFCISS